MPDLPQYPPEVEAHIAVLGTRKSSTCLERIGMGFCGSVWAEHVPELVPDEAETNAASTIAMKRGDGGPGRSLTNEYQVHKRILQKLGVETLHMPFSIPSCYAFLDEKANHWSEILPRLPARSTACNAIISEKISPMPRAVRRILAEKYFRGSKEKIDAIMADVKNHHCLVRPYLGRRRHRQTQDARPRQHTFFSLRNFPLHIDQIEELGLAIEEYAECMADALAFLHWRVGIDANDVEFVLAAPRSSSDTDNGPTTFDSGALGRHSIWVLDFDCCGDLPLDESGVDIAARAFWRNDPYYPRPGSAHPADERLWVLFRTRFLETSQLMLSGNDSTTARLPEMLMDRIVETRGVYAKGIPADSR